MPAQPFVTLAVSSIVGVLSTINLDNQSLLSADKVNHVGANGLLANEFATANRARAQSVPKP